LTQGLARIGKNVIITSREPSLGPCSDEGGAQGGGVHDRAAAKINLFMEISTPWPRAQIFGWRPWYAHLFHGNEFELDPERITWPAPWQMERRALRDLW